MKKVVLVFIFLILSSNTVFADNIGFYNGFAEQEVNVECQELSGQHANAALLVRNSNGNIIYNKNFSISANGVINEVLPRNIIANSYGSYLVQSLGNLSCHSMFYRFEDDGNIDFAYSLPEINIITGESNGVYNSHNPNAVAPATQNWKTVYNASNNPFSAWLEIYDQVGSLIDRIRISNLPKEQRIDIPLGHILGEVVGMYKIVPDNPTQEYSSYLLRILKENNDFIFAFPMLPAKPVNDSGLLNASTMAGAANWAEIANTSSQVINTALEVFNRFGEKIGTRNLTINPRAQTHVYLNEFIGSENVGSFRVSTSENVLLVSSLYYGQSQGRTTWAYASQAYENRENKNWSVIVNKNYRAFNWLKVQSSSLEILDFTHTTHNSINANKQIQHYSTTGSLDIHHAPLTSIMGKSVVNGSINSYTELIKVFMNIDGTVRYIANVRPSLIDGSNTNSPTNELLPIPRGGGPATNNDLDSDGILDASDNCQGISNPTQEDLDQDGFGDLCDSDDDNDGVEDNFDNCPDIYNPGQEDWNEDRQGNECDSSQYNLNTGIAVETINQSGKTLLTEKKAIQAHEVAVLVNTNDPQSVEVAAYYVAQRQIPEENVIELSFSTGSTVMSTTTFNTLKTEVDNKLSTTIQAIAISWTDPWRVEKMSITSAFALGLSDHWYGSCGSTCCSTGATPYQSPSAKPLQDSSIRLVTMLGGETVEFAKELIDRSVIADNTFPTGDGYFVRTTDRARSVRYSRFNNLVNKYNDTQDGLSLFYQDGTAGQGNLVSNTNNVLFYMTGLTSVSNLNTNTYLPGSFADHLTSFAGRITGSNGQMSALRWLEAGASGSHGTVVEPCNYTSKFPNAELLVPSYFSGATLAQAMWYSVAWPGEGIFLGDPLTKPWGTKLELTGENIDITTTALRPNINYVLLGSNNKQGPYNPISFHNVDKEKFTIISDTEQYSNYILAHSGMITKAN